MRHCISVLLLILSINVVFAQSPPPETDDLLAETWAEVASYYPRHESSEGESLTFDLISQRLTALSIPYTERRLDQLPGVHSFSRVIEATIPGRLPDRLIVAVPVNSRYGAPPQNDGSIAVSAALTMADRLARMVPDISVTLLFLGAEREELPGYPIGSRLFARDFVADRATMVVYLDINSPTESFVIESAAGGLVTPSWAVSALSSVLTDAGVPYRADSIRNQLHRAGVGRDTPAIRPLLEAGIPAIGLRNLGDSDTVLAVPTLQSIESVITALMSLVDRFDNGIPTHWDRHYVFFQLGRSLLVFGEQAYLLTILLLIAGLLFYAVAFRVRFERYGRTIIRNFWSIPAVYLLLLGVLLLGTLVITRFLDLRSYPQLWHHRPIAFFTLKLSIAVFLFTITTLPLRRTLLASTSSFYSAAALVVLFTAIVVLAVVQISFTYYFTWAFLWAFLFSVLSFRPLKILCLAAAPVPLIHAAFAVYGGEEFAAGRFLLLSPIEGNLLVALVVLPFLLMLIRLDFVIRHPRVGRRSFVLKIVATVSAIAILVFSTVVFSLAPYSLESPQPVSVTERIDTDTGSHTMTFHGRTELAGLPFRVGDTPYVWQGEPVSLPSIDHVPVAIGVERFRFLGRNRIRFIVNSDTRLYLVSAQMVSDGPLLIYDTNLPVTEFPDENRARIHIGVLPPVPLVIDVTIAEGARGRVEFEVETELESQPISTDENVTIVSRRQIFHFAVEL